MTPIILAAAPPSPEQYYAQALAVMRALPQPAKVTVSVSAVGNGVGVYAGPGKNPEDARYAWVQFGSEFSTTAASWSDTFDYASDSATVDTQNAKALIGIGPLFDPTWYGAYDWLRYGLDGRPHPSAAGSAPAPDPRLETIATLTVMAPGAYRVSDAGARPCPSGEAGHHLQFAAREDWTRHPLTDVTIDERTMRFCSVRFRIDPKHVRGGTGIAQIDFADVSGYWLETESRIDFLGRIFGIGVRHVSIDLTYRVTNVLQYPRRSNSPSSAMRSVRVTVDASVSPTTRSTSSSASSNRSRPA